MARRIGAEDDKDLQAFIKSHEESVLRDRDDRPAFLATSAWELNYEMGKNQRVRILKTTELEYG